jgi:hypothetical protein
VAEGAGCPVPAGREREGFIYLEGFVHLFDAKLTSGTKPSRYPGCQRTLTRDTRGTAAAVRLGVTWRFLSAVCPAAACFRHCAHPATMIVVFAYSATMITTAMTRYAAPPVKQRRSPRHSLARLAGHTAPI